jgi:hypothetical protein
MDNLHHNEKIFTIIGPALTSSARRVKGLLIEKKINRWLSNIALLYSVDENISLISLTYLFKLEISIFWLFILLNKI